MSEHDQKIGRREALARLGSATLAATAVGTGTFAFLDRGVAEAGAAAVPDWRVERTIDPSRRAVVARGDDPAANVRRAIAAVGGMERFVRKGETVLVKPNVGWDRLPEQAANTEPRVVAELVRLCRAAGAKKVVVADLSCNDGARSFARSGIAGAAREAGAEVHDHRSLKLVPANLTGTSAGLAVFEAAIAADRVINVPIAKHHGLSRVTIGMKNWFGLLGSGRNRLHQDIDRCIAELGAIFRPTLTVIDATRVLLANGPTGGSLSDVKSVGAICVGLDPVLCDAWGAVQLGVDPRTLRYLAEAEKRNLGRGDTTLVRELGKA